MNVHFSPVFDRIQTPVQIEKRERHALIPRRRRRRRHTRHTRPGCCCLFLGCSHLYSSPVVSYDIVTVVVIITSLLHIRFYSSALNIKIFLFFSLFCLCVHTKAHTQRRGGRPFRLKRGGAKKRAKRERERFCSKVCVCFSFVFFRVFLPSFVKRGDAGSTTTTPP